MPGARWPLVLRGRGGLGMTHPMAVLVGGWPTNATTIESGCWGAQLRLAPDALDVLVSAAADTDGSAPWMRAARARKRKGANARIVVLRFHRLPLLLEYGPFAAAVQPAEIALKTGHTLVTLPREMLRAGSGVWKGISFRHVARMAESPVSAWPAQGAALATMAAASPPAPCATPPLPTPSRACAPRTFPCTAPWRPRPRFPPPAASQMQDPSPLSLSR